MLDILLIIGKVLLILLLLILAILFILLVCPFFWKIHLVKDGGKFRIKGGLASTLGLIWLKLDFDRARQDKAFTYDLRVFGIPVLKILKDRKEKKEKAGKEAERKKKEEIRKHIREGTIPENAEKRKHKRKLPDSVPASERRKRKKKDQEEERFGNTFFGTNANKISYRIREFFRKLKNGFEKIGDWEAYLGSESFDRVKQVMGRELPPVFRILLPKRVKGFLNFGFEDPAVTGEALGALALLLGITDQLQIRPDFEKQKFEADVTAKGRLILLMLLIHVLKIVLNKDVKSLIKRFK